MAELSCHSIGVRFGGLQALQDVDLRVTPGQVTGLIGPNGAGKTTLFNVVTGIQPPSAGTVRLGDKDITKLRPARRAKMGLARTFQRLELFGTLTTRENIQMAAETQRAKLPKGVSPIEQTERLIDRVGLRNVADEATDSLPTGQARQVELARALATTPEVLLLDEPSAGLDHVETAELGRLLIELADDGIAVLLVEHDMSLVMTVCHEINVLDFGELIASGDPESVKADPAVQVAYLGAEVDGDQVENGPAGSEMPSPAELASLKPAVIHAKHSPEAPESTNGSPPADGATPASDEPAGAAPATVAAPHAAADGTEAPPLLELKGIKAAYGRIEVVHGVDLAIARGSVTALLGPNGAGKSTLLKVACGLLPPSGGSLLIDGEPVRKLAAERLARKRFCTLPEGRAVFPNLTVAENLRMFTYRGRDVRLRDLEERAFQRFPLLGERRRQLAGRLSGGEQQMLALARALYTDPEMLMLDELSMGLAPLIVSQLYEAVGQLVEREKLTVLLVEQFATTALTIADQACVMVTGEIVERGEPEVIGERLASTYLGTSS